MPTLPDKTALGMPSVSASIPGISVPVNPTGAAVARLGSAVTQLGGELMAGNQQADKFDAQRRFIEFQDQRTDELARSQRDAQPGAPDFETHTHKAFKTAGDEFFRTLPPNLRGEYAPRLLQLEGQIRRQARDFEWKSADGAIDGLLSDSAQRLYNRVGEAGRPGSAEDKQLVLDAHGTAQGEAEQLIDAAPLTAVQRDVAKRNVRTKLLKVTADRLAEVDPTGAIEALSGRSKAGEGPQPSPDQAALANTATRLGISPRDLAAAISYETGGTFDPGIMGGKGGRYRGLIQFGPEEQATYRVRPGMTIAEQLPAVEAFLRDRGLKPGSGIAEIYRTINGGTPNASLTASDGNGTIAQHIEKIKAGHYESADKWLGAASDVPGDPRFAALPLSDRQTAIRKAQEKIDKKDTDGNALFDQRLADTRAQAFNTGVVASPLTETEFTKRLGAEAGAIKFKDYQADLAAGAQIPQLAKMTPAETQGYLASITPAEGSAGYAHALLLSGKVVKKAGELAQARTEDPAAYAIKYLPATQEAWGKLQTVLRDPAVSAADRTQAARDYAAKAQLDQERVGVAADDRRIVPATYVDTLVRTLEHPELLKRADGKGATPLDAARLLEQEAKLWGDAWPLVSRDVQGKATIPTVRVLATGVSDQAAMVLPTLMGSSLTDILKGHGDESIKTLKHDVDLAMRKFAGTMLGTREQMSFFNDYVATGEKLAAHYVLNGKASGDAAKLAFEHLLGHKYDFVEGGLFGAWGSTMGTVRVPKGIGIPVDRITRGAEEARNRLEWLDVAPATAPGLTPETLKHITASGFARDAVWATAPGDSGLMLVLNGKVVERGPDGGERPSPEKPDPLILTWRDLSGFADQADRRGQPHRALGAMPKG